jgi:hypothetical protein
MGLILGRSPNLWLGAFTAIWSVAVIVFKLDPTVAAAVTAAAGAIITLVAGTDSIQIAAGNAAQARQGK